MYTNDPSIISSALIIVVWMTPELYQGRVAMRPPGVCVPNRSYTPDHLMATFPDIVLESSKTTIIRAELIIDGLLVYIDTLAVDWVANTPVRHYVPPVIELSKIPWRPRLIMTLGVSFD